MEGRKWKAPEWRLNTVMHNATARRERKRRLDISLDAYESYRLPTTTGQ